MPEVELADVDAAADGLWERGVATQVGLIRGARALGHKCPLRDGALKLLLKRHLYYVYVLTLRTTTATAAVLGCAHSYTYGI